MASVTASGWGWLRLPRDKRRLVSAREEAERIWEAVEAAAWRMDGRQPCCGATNKLCPRPPGVVHETATGCERCGHPKPCHVRAWS